MQTRSYSYKIRNIMSLNNWLIQIGESTGTADKDSHVVCLEKPGREQLFLNWYSVRVILTEYQELNFLINNLKT